ncbi:IclR family transcriptional regulator [Chthonobacter rhizosphaerae]|uniref:IclR family transcriptional regulator n=1 Tax=Chthonobacter rhizosphaerae TaxID=2735553 RepID=UPI0015EFA5D1|nr:IclR family transcriptional regulator [Chthonobacter rhizosphaerae]
MDRRETDSAEPPDDEPDGTGDSRDRRYTAPALEKGLDILERLSEERRGLTLSELADGLGRTKGEIFRMVAVLEARGFLARGEDDRLSITDKLFRMGLNRPAYRSLLGVALPLMHAFAERTGYSCHLAVPSETQMVVIARVESVTHIGFSVRIGYRQPLMLTGSGHCLLAFMGERRRNRILDAVEARDPTFDRADFLDTLARLRAAGRVRRPSGTAEGVTDLSAPVFDSGEPVAALTSPYLRMKSLPIEPDALLQDLVGVADEITAAMATD